MDPNPCCGCTCTAASQAQGRGEICDLVRALHLKRGLGERGGRGGVESLTIRKLLSPQAQPPSSGDTPGHCPWPRRAMKNSVLSTRSGNSVVSLRTF